MKLMKKFALQIHSRIDAMADSFENREAIANAYIREYEQMTAKAKVKQQQISAEIRHLKKEISSKDQQIELWAERARQVHPVDEAKALECVARRKKVQVENINLKRKLNETLSIHDQMSKDLQLIFSKLEDLKHKHQNLSSRQLCTDTLHKVQHNSISLDQEVDDLFNRWETDIVASELSTQHPAVERDELAEEFNAQEKAEELKEDLDEIINDALKEQEK